MRGMRLYHATAPKGRRRWCCFLTCGNMPRNPRLNRCGHPCPVCGGEAYPLASHRPTTTCTGCEGDVPWRLKMGRIAHKCYGIGHRFDVDLQTGESLPNFAIRPDWWRGGSQVAIYPARGNTKKRTAKLVTAIKEESRENVDRRAQNADEN